MARCNHATTDINSRSDVQRTCVAGNFADDGTAAISRVIQSCHLVYGRLFCVGWWLPPYFADYHRRIDCRISLEFVVQSICLLDWDATAMYLFLAVLRNSTVLSRGIYRGYPVPNNSRIHADRKGS